MAKKVIKLSELSNEQKRKFREKYDYIFFDMDGTLEVLNDEAIPCVPEAVQAVAACVEDIYVITDTCLYSREAVAVKLQRNFPFIKKEKVVPAGFLVAESLKRMGFKKKVYVLGAEDGIVEELKLAGYEVITDQPTGDLYTVQDVFNVTLDPQVGAVVVASDLNFSYMKLLKAVNYLLKPEVLFLATQPYVKLSFPGRPIMPACGALVKAISVITRREPAYYSKGSDASVQYVRSLGYDMKKCLFVGDGIFTDVKFGNMCGMDTLLVLCGHTTEHQLHEQIEKGDSDFIPTYYTNSTADLKDIYS